MEDVFNLKRFIDAQSKMYERALGEIKSGRKISHWMWYIFPQYYGLGRSSTSIKYAIRSEEEAVRYLQHPTLGSHLVEITETFLLLQNKTANDVLGYPDDVKLKSSMTLFGTVQTEITLFNDVLDKYFEGNKCRRTISALKFSKGIFP